MLTADQLATEFFKNFSKTKVADLAARVRAEEFNIDQLIDLTFHPEKTLAFRASWLLDRVMLGDKCYHSPHVKYLVSRVKEVTNESCKRQYARIMMFMTLPNAPEVVKQTMNEIELEDLVEQFFDWIIDLKVKIAVKVFAADTLYNLRGRYDWIAEELALQTEFLMQNGGPFIKLRGEKLIAALTK